MSRFDRVPNIPVAIGPCLCPGEPHDGGDVVYLAPVLSAPGGMAAQGAIAEASTDGVLLQELLWRVYRNHGVVGWNLVDEEGEAVPLTPENVEIALPYGKGGRLVADKADELYSEDILVPFLARIKLLEQAAARQKPSPVGSIKPSRKATSRRRTSTRKRRLPLSTPATAEAPPAG